MGRDRAYTLGALGYRTEGKGLTCLRAQRSANSNVTSVVTPSARTTLWRTTRPSGSRASSVNSIRAPARLNHSNATQVSWQP